MERRARALAKSRLSVIPRASTTRAGKTSRGQTDVVPRTDPHRACGRHAAAGSARQPRYLQARYPDIATAHDWYMALAYTVRDRLLERWVRTVQTYAARDVKVVCYLSAEFLLGPHWATTC